MIRLEKNDGIVHYLPMGSFMEIYKIKGGKRCHGRVRVSGNKNAALPCLAATLLTDEPVILDNVPHIKDIEVMCALLRQLGSTIEYIGRNKLQITSGGRDGSLKTSDVHDIRASILLVGALLPFRQRVEIAPPGGDVIGYRRIDTHLHGFEKVGVSFEQGQDTLIFHRETLHGNEIFLEEASVTATENLLLVASHIEEETVIFNCACEPHVQDLCHLLVCMGCRIEGIGSNLLKITGSNTLRGCTYRIGCDYMEVGTMIGLAVATKGSITIEGLTGHHIKEVLANGFSKLGVEIEEEETNLIISQKKKRQIPTTLDGVTNKIDDAPWPGFPSDLLSILTVCATQIEGSIVMHEKMFESRMFFIDSLMRMGADIVLCDPHRAVVRGENSLHAIRMSSPDVRAGMALLIAATCSSGTSTIDNIYQIERGYDGIVDKLQKLGIDIWIENQNQQNL